MNYFAFVAAVVGAFAASSAWYIAFGKEMAKQRAAMTAGAAADIRRAPAWKYLAELGRNFVIAFVLAQLVGLVGIVDWVGAAQLGALVWIGFPLVILAGSAMWENVPWRLAAIHSGDWLVKLLLLAVILGVWR